MPRNSSKLTYQPFVFGMSIAALVAKVSYSLASHREVFDITLYALLVIFGVAALMYIIEHRRLPEPTSLQADVTVGKVQDSHVVGAEGGKQNKTVVKVNTGDVSGGTVTGYRERNEK